jgi:ABC-type lipoprotein release transport system permease subunit
VLKPGHGCPPVRGRSRDLDEHHLSVLENEREFATLQAIGYGRGLIVRIVLTEACVYGGGAFALSVSVAIMISEYLNYRLSAASVQIQHAFPLHAFASVLGPALLLIPIPCFPAIRRIVRSDTLQSIRSRVAE